MIYQIIHLSTPIQIPPMKKQTPTAILLPTYQKRKTPTQQLDGVSLKPLLIDPNESLKNHIYHVYIRKDYIGEAIRNERYRMIRWTNLNDENNILYELYDYEKDPQEIVNISKKNLEWMRDGSMEVFL